MSASEFTFTETNSTATVQATNVLVDSNSVEVVITGGTDAVGVGALTDQGAVTSARIASLFKTTTFDGTYAANKGGIGLFGMMQTGLLGSYNAYIACLVREDIAELYDTLYILRDSPQDMSASPTVLGSVALGAAIDIDDLFSLTLEFQAGPGGAVSIGAWCGTSSTWTNNERFSDVTLATPDLHVFDATTSKLGSGQNFGVCWDRTGTSDITHLIDSTMFHK